MLIEFASVIPYRLAASATPSPNDLDEFGMQAEFLGVMSASEMEAEFFIQDGGDTQTKRLKGHAEQHFWKWLASFATVFKDPADIGFPHESSMFNLPAIQDELMQARQALETAKHKQAESERLLIEQIGRWKQHVVDAKRFDAVAKEASTHDSAVTNLAKAIDDSSARQETARKTLEQTKRVANASAAHTQVLRRVFNEAATGTIQVDGFGLQSKPAKQLTPGGRALSAMATVVSFDLACVMLSIAGVGNHLRFLIHDSPREGEMEMPLFKRIFDVACYLESCFGNSPPSFQYIVTTTKAPPSYCTENEPHTRLVLHGREDDGRLLRLTF
jgi:hypothetical protein